MLVLVADSTAVRGAETSVVVSPAMALPAPLRASIATAAALIAILVIGYSLRMIMGTNLGDYTN